MADETTTFGANFLTDVEQLLTAMGYVKQETDNFLLQFCVDRVTERIKNACNVSEIPNGLRYTAVDLMAVEFLSFQIGAGATAGFENLNFEPVVKQLEEGDTNIVYAVDVNSSDSAQLLGLLNLLKTTAEAQFVTYRRIAW